MTGIELIAKERKRQMEEEGWSVEHDAEHEDTQIVLAGVAYALEASDHRDLFATIGLAPFLGHNAGKISAPALFWPWGSGWWKPSEDPVRNLTKAGALIAAEIDRLQRERALKKTEAADAD